VSGGFLHHEAGSPAINYIIVATAHACLHPKRVDLHRSYARAHAPLPSAYLLRLGPSSIAGLSGWDVLDVHLTWSGGILGRRPLWLLLYTSLLVEVDAGRRGFADDERAQHVRAVQLRGVVGVFAGHVAAHAVAELVVQGADFV